MEQYNAEYGRKGLPLKTITYSTITDQKGKVTRDTVTTLITEIQRGPINPSMLKIPDGYEVVNIGQQAKASAKPPQ
jgi:hypothetical protein